MAVSRKTVMAFTSYQNLAIKSYQNQAHVLVKNYLLADPFIPYTSILGGIFLFKVVNSCLSVEYVFNCFNCLVVKDRKWLILCLFHLSCMFGYLLINSF
jgi:hypothetical protein